MNIPLDPILSLQRWREEFRGVFSLSDLKNLFGMADNVQIHRLLARLEKTGALQRFCRSIYVTEGYDLDMVSARICPSSSISCGSALSRHLLIGTIPRHQVIAVKTGRNRTYRSGTESVVHLGVAPHLAFGSVFEDGVQYADKEKAFLDTLYFHQRGRRFPFDIYRDVNASLLDRDKIWDYLSRYRNPRFVRFVENCLNV